MFRTLITSIFALFAAFGGQAQSTVETVVFRSGDNGYACYRIPAIVRAADGTLLAFAEGRRDSNDDKGAIDLVLRRSADNGRTWGEQTVVWHDGDNTCGNPTPIVERETGRVILLACWNRGEDHEKEIEAGRTTDTRRVFSMYSDDNGVSWSAPIEITPSVKHSDWTWYATGPCHAIQKAKGPHKGRIVASANHKKVGEDGKVLSCSQLLYSDDGGKTWQLGAVAPSGSNESTVAELSDGSLMLNMRRYIRTDSMRLVGVSRDGGLTWKSMRVDSLLIEPRCQGSLLNYTPQGDKPSKTLLFSNPHSRKRENLTIGVSRDNGRTWSRFVSVCKGPAAYSDLVCLPDGSVGVLYEGWDKTKKFQHLIFDVVSPVRLFD